MYLVYQTKEYASISPAKNLQNKFTEEKTIVKVRDSSLVLRLLISKSKRIIISNIHPAIENELKKTNIISVSQITPIRAGMHDLGFTHIMCFRRHMTKKKKIN